jgi:thiol-disulfide isomerase/thioredoxin
MNLLPEKLRVAQCSSEEAAFSFWIPPGRYELWGYGTDVRDRYLDLTLQSDNQDCDLQTVNLEPTISAQRYGKEPPEWHITAARGMSTEAKLRDFKGKWVILEFWASYCGPCTHQSLPALMEFHEKYARQGKVQILAFHKHNIKTFEELDAELEPIIREVWYGKTLPFPILLDATGQTIADFGISFYPTAVFIDPEGKVAKGLDLKELEARLEADRSKIIRP